MIFLARILAIILAVGACVGVAHAQLNPISQSILQLTITPENPAPNEKVSARVDSYNFDLDTTEVVWYVNGTLQKRGVGERQLTLTAPSLGKTLSIRVVARHKTLGDLEQSISLRTGDVEVVWEALGYTPPFYKGKTQHSYGGVVRFTAIPRLTDRNGTEISANNLIYTWKKNGTVIQDQSGYGKITIITADDSYIRDGNDISVDVSSMDHTAQATGYSSVSPKVSQVLVYEKDPALGTRYEKALANTIHIAGDEMELVAEPYFFSVTNRDAGYIDYSWLVNDQPVSGNDRKSGVVLKPAVGATGKASLSLIVQNNRQILQGGKLFSTIYFGN
ncbi:MAG: hypothetical protein RLZZ347_842 [Candidatus Parcubacteria bacterium]|jgi:hypothetical protein